MFHAISQLKCRNLLIYNNAEARNIENVTAPTGFQLGGGEERRNT